MMWYWGSGVHWWGWLLGAAAMVLFWALVAWAIWTLVAWVRIDRDKEPRSAPPGPPSPRDVLDQRLARGEIGPDEYRRLRDLLDEHRHTPAA